MRLIDADKLRDGWLDWNPYEIIEANTVLESIDQQPTIDAEPVRHGRWVPLDGTLNVECSECKAVRNAFSQAYWSYCPNCGNPMDEGDNHEKAI